MKKNVLIFSALLVGISALLLAGVKTDYAHSVNFANYHTYSWIKVQAGNQLWQDRIMRDVDQALEQKGWQKMPSGGQVGVTAFGKTHNVPSFETFYDGLGGGWGWRGFGGEGIATTTEENDREGMLTVDLFDQQNKHLIWRGMATNSLSGNPEKNAKNLDKQVEDMFKNFPPKPKG